MDVDALIKNCIKLKTLLSSEEKWIKGLFATDENNRLIDLYDHRACKFCLYGAANKVDNRFTRTGIDFLVHLKINLPPGFDSVTSFNDDPNTSFLDVQQYLDKCLASAKELETFYK